MEGEATSTAVVVGISSGSAKVRALRLREGDSLGLWRAVASPEIETAQIERFDRTRNHIRRNSSSLPPRLKAKLDGKESERTLANLHKEHTSHCPSTRFFIFNLLILTHFAKKKKNYLAINL